MRKHLLSLSSIRHFLTTILWFTLHEISAAQTRPTTQQFIAELGCASCHVDLSIESNLKNLIPNLSHAGLRYNPAYLFDYLQHPTKIRRHLGRARMPDFHFSEKEALALTLFLETQKKEIPDLPAFPAELSAPLHERKRITSKEKFRVIIGDSLICISCHTFEGKGDTSAVGLETFGYRFQAEWLKKFLITPNAFDVPLEIMPALFYNLSPDKRKFIELMPRPAESINRLTDYLFSLTAEKRTKLEKAFVRAKAADPDVSIETGRRIFLAQNCLACHQHNTMQQWRNDAAPDLRAEGIRVQKEWLEEFLKNPKPIRPFGYHPGSGSRMPDFKLTDDEAKIIGDFLFEQKRGANALTQAFKPAKLSVFSMNKAKALLGEKLACIGCHRLGETGGRIGPDLSNISNRLQPAFVFNVIKNPRVVLPHTVMPQVPMPPKTAELIANFLMQAKHQQTDSPYLSLVENPITLFDEKIQPKGDYQKYCAPCHGEAGDGRGHNARFLPRKPAVHADAGYMSTRPDDTLFDGISAGGAILNKSHFMPPWGQTLSNSEMNQLVNYLRDLCKCQGPEWSRDN